MNKSEDSEFKKSHSFIYDLDNLKKYSKNSDL